MINSRMPSNLLITRIASDIVQKQSDLAQIQETIASGKKVNRPSDAPAQAAHIISMQEATAQLDQFQRNASSAESQLVLEESALTGAVNSLGRIRELALSSNSGVADDTTRAAINAEVKLRLDELYEMANSKDSFGNYLFAGTNTQNRPFSKGVPVNYSGSDDTTQASVGLGRRVATGDSGADVFMRIRNGNGDFQVQSDTANTGTGIIYQGSVNDPSQYDAKPYAITFTSDTTFDIVDTSTGSAIQSGNNYTPGNSIEFQGISTTISGTPLTGDTFRVLPSANQDVFSTIQGFVDALGRSPADNAGKARMQQDVNDTLVNIDQALDHLNTTRARVGTRLSSIDSSREDNANFKLQIERTRAEIEDIDIAEAVTDLQTRANSLEILQKSFVRIEGMSLFNYM